MNVNIKVQDKAEAHIPLFPELAKDIQEEAQLESIGILEGGMESGRPSLMLNVRLANGKIVLVQCTGSIFLGISAVLKGAMQRWGVSE